MNRKLFFLAVLILCFFDLWYCSSDCPIYGHQPGHTGRDWDSCAFGINDSGQILAQGKTPPPLIMLFLQQLDNMTDIGTLGGMYSEAKAINTSGQVVGWAYTTGIQHAFIYSNGTMCDLGSLGRQSCACGINASGKVVGYSLTYQYDDHAFLYSNGTMTDLGVLGGDYSYAYGINDSGQIVGYSDGHAFLYSGSTMKDLGTLGGTTSRAYGINASGQAWDIPITASCFARLHLQRLEDRKTWAPRPDRIAMHIALMIAGRSWAMPWPAALPILMPLYYNARR